MFETIFLTVLVIALALGNVFLSLLNPKRLERLSKAGEMQDGDSGLGQASVQDSFSESRISNEFPIGSQSTDRSKMLDDSTEKQDFDSNANRERIRYLGKRIDRLEQLLLKLNKSDFVAKKINSTNLGHKLSDIDKFKQKTRLEIAALKQRLDKVQPAARRSKELIPDISDKRLHELVFRTR